MGEGAVYIFAGLLALVVTPYLHVLGIFMLVIAIVYLIKGAGLILYGLTIISTPFNTPFKSLEFINKERIYEEENNALLKKERKQKNRKKMLIVFLVIVLFMFLMNAMIFLNI